ncbi:MAG: hypothetical protein ABL967_20835, partial [Bryobacteraceae bacterium]
LELVALNVDLANDTAGNLAELIARTEAEIGTIETEARAALSKKVKDQQDYYGRILTSLSLSMDGALGIATSLSDRLFSKGPETGTVFDFIA